MVKPVLRRKSIGTKVSEGEYVRLESPLAPVTWYGASAVVGAFGANIASGGAVVDAMEEEAAPYGPQINAAGQFIQGLTTMQPVTTVPGMIGRAIKIGLLGLFHW